jgi:hypothetical protein
MLEILYRGHGINWTWYGKVLVSEPFIAAVPDSSFRLHKFDERQGANDHPDTPWDLETYNGGNTYKTEHEGAMVRRRKPYEEGDRFVEYVETIQGIMCDIVHGMWVPRKMQDWVLESKAKYNEPLRPLQEVLNELT